MNFTAYAAFHTNYLGNGEYDHHPERPMFFDAAMPCVDRDEAEKVVAQFPKYVNMKIRRYLGAPGFDHIVVIRINFTADGVNDGKNETGLKRLNKFLEIAGNLKWKSQSVNTYETLEDFINAAR